MSVLRRKDHYEGVILHMNNVESPQQVMSSLLKDTTKEKLYVVYKAPCYKKRREVIPLSDSKGRKEAELVLASN
jgi:iron only hydrogenase large subunit-like protein